MLSLITYGHRVLDFCTALYQRSQQDNAALGSAAIAFYFLLTLIPLLLLFIALLAFFVPITTIQSQIEAFTATVGLGIGHAIRTEVLTIINHRRVLTGIALLLSLWIGSQIFHFIELALNQIWRVRQPRDYFRSLGLSLIMTLCLGALVGLALSLTSVIHLFNLAEIPLAGHPFRFTVWLTFLIGLVLPFLLITLVFTVIYRIMPNTVVPWRNAIIGASVASALWLLVSNAFSWYTAHFTHFSLLYGSFGGIILLMFWFKYSAQILLVGAEIAVLLQERQQITPTEF